MKNNEAQSKAIHAKSKALDAVKKNGWDSKTLHKVKAKKLGMGGTGFSYKDLK